MYHIMIYTIDHRCANLGVHPYSMFEELKRFLRRRSMPKMPDGEYPWRSLGGKLKMGMEIADLADLADFYRFLMFFWFQRFWIFPRIFPFGSIWGFPKS